MKGSKLIINFVIPEGRKYKSYSLFNGDIDNEWWLFNCGEWAWIVQTYHRLIKYSIEGLSVSSSAKPVSDSINVIFSDDYLNLKNKADYYCAVVILDRFVFYPGNLSIVQNKEHSLPFRFKYVTHWSQAGLVPKDNTIKNKVIKIGFFGLPANSIDLLELANDIENKDVELIIAGPKSWNDYSEIDIAIGIRCFSGKRYNQKPPTKLLNAWRAGVPFIGGVDSAYSQVGENKKNYIRVNNRVELVEAIDVIINDSVFSKNLIDNGFDEFKKYSNKNIEKEWLDLLFNEEVNFNNWKRKSNFQRNTLTYFSFLYYNYLRFIRRVKLMLGLYN